MDRRRFLSVVLPALAAARCSRSESPSNDRRADPAAGGNAAPAAPAAARIRLNLAPSPGILCQTSWYLAGARGFFSEEGLDAEYLEQDWSRVHGHHLMSAWLKRPAGPVRNDVMVVEYPSLPDMASGTMDYYVIAGEHSGCRQIVCPVDSPIRTVAELRGKRMGLRNNEDSLIWEFLIGPTRAGTSPTQWIRGPFPTGDPRELDWVKQEFAASRIDAFIGADPVPEILKADGVARLVASNTWTPPLNGWYCCMLAARKELVDAHPDLPGRFTRAIRRAADFVQDDPDKAVAFAVARGYFAPSIRQDLYARLLGEYVWTATGRIEEDLERYFQLLIDAGRIPATTPPRELVKRVYRGAEA